MVISMAFDFPQVLYRCQELMPLFWYQGLLVKMFVEFCLLFLKLKTINLILYAYNILALFMYALYFYCGQNRMALVSNFITSDVKLG